MSERMAERPRADIDERAERANGPSGRERTSMSDGVSGRRARGTGPGVGDERLPVDRHLLDALAALPTAPAAGPDAPGPRRQPADGRRRHGALRGPGHQPPPRPGRPLAAGPRPRLLHDRLGRPRGQRRGRRGAASDRPGPPPLPLRRASTCAGPCRSRDTTPGGTSCSASWRPRTSRWPAAATRSSATTTWRSSPRPRPSPPTCREPSASPSASTAPTASACRRRGRPTRWPSAASATRRPTTRRRPGPSTPPPASPTSTCRSRSCSSARTTASGSACAPRRAGSGPPTPNAPTCAGSRPTAPIPRPPTRPRWPPPSGSAPSGRRRSCTCARSASWPTPARTSRPRTGRRPRSADDYARDPHPRHGPPHGRGGRGHADRPGPPLRAHPLGGAGAGRWSAPPTTS